MTSATMIPAPGKNQTSRPAPRERRYGRLSTLQFSSSKELARAASDDAAAHLRAVLDEQEFATVILATGQSQLFLLDTLVARGDIDWSRLVLFHMDEYLGLPAGHPASFRRYLKERVTDRVACRAFHFLRGDALEPIRECERYADLLRRQPIDLCFLGVGNNGHLAFNDPPVARFDDPYAVKIVRLDEVCRAQQVSQGHFASVHDMPQYALTITLPMLCSSRALIGLVSGDHKAHVVQAMLEEPIKTQCPASVLRLHDQARLYLDAAAARWLV